MKFIIVAISILFFSNNVNAGTIIYNDINNSWTITGFQKTNIGSWVNTGFGGIENNGGTIFGGASVSLNTFSGGQWIVRGGSGGNTALTDNYFPLTETITVQNVTWTNQKGQQTANLGDGVLFFALGGTQTWNDAPINGTILNGTFSYASGSVNGNVIYEFTPIANVPAPSALLLFISGLIGLLSLKNKCA